MINSSQAVIVYGVSWCGDCSRTRKVFAGLDFPYTWIDIDEDQQGEAYVISTNQGRRSVPTILFPDGTMLVEPTSSVLDAKLRSLQA